ncbi:MAG: hypothetical protein C0592_04895 [Marinilabiliales bacterium]|nr:MAG: hypothetical protein C0592_04895 [Marinilabiliales bacterium]
MRKLIFIIAILISAGGLKAQEMQFGLAFGPAQMFYDQLVNNDGTGIPSIRFNNKFNFSGEFQYYYTLRKNVYIRSGLHFIYAPYLQTQVATPTYSSLYPNNGDEGNIPVFFFGIPAMLSWEFPMQENSGMLTIGLEKNFVTEEFFCDPGSSYYPGIDFRGSFMYLWHVSESFQMGIEPWGKYFLFTPEYTDGSLFAIGLQIGFRFDPYN